MKKLLLIILGIFVSYLCVYSQTNVTAGTVRTRNIVPLSSTGNLNYQNDTIVNLWYGYNGDSLIYVNDTTLIAWIQEHGGSSENDSSWTSIKVDTIDRLSGVNEITFTRQIKYMTSAVGYRNVDNSTLSMGGGSSISTGAGAFYRLYGATAAGSSFGPGSFELFTAGNGSIDFRPSGTGSVVSRANLRPFANNTNSLGINGAEWSTGYFATDIEVRDSTLLQIILANQTAASADVYYPDLTDSTNLGDIGDSIAFYQRIGDIVNVYGSYVVNVAAASDWDFYLSLPFPTTSTGLKMLTGMGSYAATSGLNSIGNCSIVSQNDLAFVQCNNTTGAGATHLIHFNFTYQIE